MTQRHQMTTLNQTYGYLERLLLPQGYNTNSCDWFELDAAPDLEMLRQAAANVCLRHAALQAVTSLGDRNGWSWHRNPDAVPKIAYVRKAGNCPPDAPETLVRANVWDQPLDLENGPPWRIHVTEYDDMTVLQSITSHVYTCGKSANLVSAELFNAYDKINRGMPLDETPVDVPDRSNRALFLSQWGVAYHLRAFAGSTVGLLKEVFTTPMKLAGNKTDVNHRGDCHVRFVDLGSDLWNQLRSFAREEGISRHPFYLAAWAEALSEFNVSRGAPVGGKVKFMDNFSLRPFSPQNLDGFYDICAVPYAIEVPSGSSTREKRKAISENVEVLRSGKILQELSRYEIYHKLTRVFPVVLTTKLLLKCILKTRFIMSNIGPVPQDLLENQSLPVRRYFSFPQLFPPGDIMLLITTTPETVRAIFLWDSDAVSNADMEDHLIPGFRAALAKSVNLSKAQTDILDIAS